jgi:hypothetical protein
MNSKLTRLLITGCMLALLVGSFDSVAQEKKIELDVEIHSDVERTFKILGSKSAFGKVVKGAPFSATAVTETIQTLGDGNQIIQKNETTLYRDTEGRTRTEQTLGTIGKWTAGGQAQQLITIYDPVADFSYNLDPHNRIANKSRLEFTEIKMAVSLKEEQLKASPPGGAPPPKTPGKGEKNIMKVTGPVEITADSMAVDGEKNIISVRDSEARRKKIESLGREVIEGVEVEHTRTTFTIPAGEIGNTLPIEVVDETWYSPELQIVVMSKHRDPRSGEKTYRLININRSEPDRAMFEVPSDYTIKEEKLPPAKKAIVIIDEK